MTYLKQKPGSLEDVIAKQQSPYQESTYQDKFKKELDKAGIGIGSMTPKEKTVFFNKVDDIKKTKQETVQTEALTPEKQKEHDKLMKDFIAKGGKVQNIPLGKRNFAGNKLIVRAGDKKKLAAEHNPAELKEEQFGANTVSNKNRYKQYLKKSGQKLYKKNENDPSKTDNIEEGASELVKKAVAIAKKMANNYTGATNAIEALKKGLSKDPTVSAALLAANEQFKEEAKLQEGRWRVEGEMGYKGISSPDNFSMVINATSEKDAINKSEKELEKARKKRWIGPGGGGNVEDIDGVYAEPTTEPLERPSSSMQHSHVPEGEKELKELAFFSKENVGHQLWGKAASNTENRGDSKLLPSKNIQQEADEKDEKDDKGASTAKVPVINKDNKPGVKIAKIRLKRDKMDGAEGSGTKDPAGQEKQILTLQGQINILKAKLENEKHKIMKPVANKVTGQVPLTVGIASKLLRDKAEKENDEDKKEVKKESVSPYKLKYETLRARLKEKAEKEKLAKKKDEPTKGRTMTGEPATKVDTKPEISYTM